MVRSERWGGFVAGRQGESPLKLTEEQKNILSLSETGRDLVILALAGTGKTTTVGLVAKRLSDLSKNGIYLAYNAEMKRTAIEKGFPAECSTIHGLAYRAIVGRGKGAIFNPTQVFNGTLPGRMISDALDLRGIAFDDRFITPQKIGSLCLSTVRNFCYSASPELSDSHVSLDDYGTFIRGILEKVQKEKAEAENKGDGQTATIQKNRIIALRDASRKLRREVLDKSRILWNEMNKTPGKARLPISHDVYLKRYVEMVAEGKLKTPSAKFVILDEAQDSNPVTIKLLNAFRENGAQSIVVGDHYQQIYEWRGTENSMKKMLESPDVSAATLSQSFRFGEEIAEFVNGYMTRYLNDGFHIRGNPGVRSRIGENSRPDAIVCRTNAGVLEALFRETKMGRRAYLPKGKEIARMIDDIEALRSGKRPKTSAFQIFRDCDELQDFSETEEGKQISGVLKMIKKYEGEDLSKILARAGAGSSSFEVTITTGHGSKGLEWDKVSLWNDFPSGKKLESSEEEQRLGYVAMTRAKSVLDPIMWKALSKSDRERHLDRRFGRNISPEQGERLFWEECFLV
jgi:hypothetical protein